MPAASLDDYLARLAEHPSVVALERTAEAGSRRAEAALGLPDPELSLGLNNVPVEDPAFDRFLPTNKAVGITQRIPHPERLRAESRWRGSEAALPRLQAAYQLSQLRAQLLSALVDLERVATVRTLLLRRAALYRELSGVLAGELAAGLAVYADLSATDASLADVERRRNELAQAELEAESELRRLVGEVPALPAPGVVLDTGEPLPRLYPVLIARQAVEVASRAVDVSRSDFLPNFGISATYQQREAGRGFSGEDWFSVRATVSIPLWSSYRQQPAYEGAVASRAASQSRADDTALMWLRRMAILRGAQATAARNVALLGEQARLVATTVASAQRNYESGLERQRSVLAAELDLNRLEIEIVDELARADRLALEHNSHLAAPGEEPSVAPAAGEASP